MARKNTHSPEKLTQTQQNRNRALELRLAGHSQQKICEITGWSKQRVSIYIKEAIANITRENAEEYLELELSRLDELWAQLWPRIVDAKSREQLKAQPWLIDRALAIMEQRAKLTGTYKAAELKAVADARGGTDSEAASMIVDLFAAITRHVDSGATEDDTAELADDEQ
ncbi:hypothetical protein [Nocardia brasiliensis]|uniref:hypothetical protein n=1 Tax=Nocardia brasiliensis TaxID=37326 RepID=UPI0024588C62|nr:hypothetical protein [Nocardia brasiliensis]